MKILCATCLAAVFAFAGCGLAPVSKAYHEHPDDKSAATGFWTGTWKANGAAEASALSCTMLQKTGNEWIATFDAVCGRNASFTFDVPGKLKDGLVVFKQTIDLGEINGGVFEWTGEIRGDTFTGKYKSSGYEGGFVMKKQAIGEGADAGAACAAPDLVVADRGDQPARFFPNALK